MEMKDGDGRLLLRDGTSVPCRYHLEERHEVRTLGTRTGHGLLKTLPDFSNCTATTTDEGRQAEMHRRSKEGERIKLHLAEHQLWIDVEFISLSGDISPKGKYRTTEE